jgi:hypothetical protein
MVVAALVKVDDHVEPRHSWRLLRWRRDRANVTLARMVEQVRPAVGEMVWSEPDLGAGVDKTLRADFRPTYAEMENLYKSISLLT